MDIVFGILSISLEQKLGTSNLVQRLNMTSSNQMIPNGMWTGDFLNFGTPHVLSDG